MPAIVKRQDWAKQMMSAHSQRAAYALQKLAEEDPTLGVLALWCRHRDVEGTEGPPAWTAGETIHYAPGFSALEPHEQVGLAAHHVLHVAFQHASRSHAMRLRFGDRFHGEVYNIAADAIVNETLLKAGFAMPRPVLALTPLMAQLPVERTVREKTLTSLDADALYILLLHDRNGSGSGRSNEEDDVTKAIRVRSAAQDIGFSPDLEDDPSTPDHSGSADEADWSQRLAFAMEQGRQAGRGIGSLGLRLEDLPSVKTPWEVVLRRILTNLLTQDRQPDHRRPARRWLALDAWAHRVHEDQPAFLPGMRQDRRMPRIVVGLDSSGSVDFPRLRNFAAQVAAIARRTQADLHLLVFDEDVRSSAVLSGPDVVQKICNMPFTRDGGTSFDSVIEEAVALDPSVIVILTDLDGPFGALIPSCPVIWAVPGEVPKNGSHPPFGSVLSLLN